MNNRCPYCECTVRRVEEGGTGVVIFKVDGKPIYGHAACKRLRQAAIARRNR